MPAILSRYGTSRVTAGKRDHVQVAILGPLEARGEGGRAIDIALPGRVHC